MKHAFLLMFALCLFAACDDAETDNLNDGGPQDSGDDSDAGDTDFEGDPSCENYPPSDENFENGSYVANYTFFDRDDTQIRMCDFIEGNRLMLLKITTHICVPCQLELYDLAALSAEYADQGVVVAEVQQAVPDQLELQMWVMDNDFYGLRSEPQRVLEYDYRKTLLINLSAAYVLIDLTSMKILNSECGSLFEDGKACLLEALQG